MVLIQKKMEFLKLIFSMSTVFRAWQVDGPPKQEYNVEKWVSERAQLHRHGHQLRRYRRESPLFEMKIGIGDPQIIVVHGMNTCSFFATIRFFPEKPL